MEIQNLEIENGKARFIVEGANPAFVNSLRRNFIGGVPTLAIEDVRFKENTSGLFDEALAHRLGLIPWKFDPEDLNLQEECTCNGEGCQNCTVTFTLEGEGDSNLKAKDIKAPKGIEPAKPDLLVIELTENQKVSIEADGKLGFGRDHAKWQASNSAYQYYPKVEVTGEIENPEEIIERCPSDVFEIKNGELKVKNPEDCILCRVCQNLDENIEVSQEDDKFIFRVESVSGLEPEEVVKEGVDTLKNQLNGFQDSINDQL